MPSHIHQGYCKGVVGAEQVYKGRLRSNGAVVAVKVQRPGVRESIALDIHILRGILTQVALPSQAEPP